MCHVICAVLPKISFCRFIKTNMAEPYGLMPFLMSTQHGDWDKYFHRDTNSWWLLSNAMPIIYKPYSIKHQTDISRLSRVIYSIYKKQFFKILTLLFLKSAKCFQESHFLSRLLLPRTASRLHFSLALVDYSPWRRNNCHGK